MEEEEGIACRRLIWDTVLPTGMPFVHEPMDNVSALSSCQSGTRI